VAFFDRLLAKAQVKGKGREGTISVSIFSKILKTKLILSYYYMLA
jgi:hypothetical protein